MYFRGNLTQVKALAKEFTREERKEEKNQLVQLGKTIVNYIQNGVLMEDGTIRAFDYIDYLLITSFTFDELFYIIRDCLSLEEIKIFRGFQYHNDNPELYSEEHFRNMVYRYNVEFDQRGKVIEGSGKEITLEEKETVINIINEMGWNQTRALFNAFIERCKKGYLNITVDKTRTLKK